VVGVAEELCVGWVGGWGVEEVGMSQGDQ
jgi:hypothetical protein